MSLRIWLPMTKDLRNQGLDEVTVTNNGATYSATGGKLGGCYDFDGSSINFNNVLTYPCSQFSVAGWINLDSGYTVNNGFHIIDFQATYGRICISKDGSAVRVLLAGESQGGYSSTMTASQLSAGVWHHYAITFDSGDLRIYIDGVLDKAQTTAMTYITYSNNVLGIGSHRTELPKGKLNDFRLYNHALSPMEVKQISQGLILHYSLDRNGMGPDNLIPNSLTYSGWSINSLWTQSTSNGEIIWSASRTGATSYLWNRIIPPTQFNPNNYPNGITVSFDFKCDDINALDHKCICALQIYKSDGTRIGWYESKNSFTETNYIGSSTLQNGQWKRLSCYFTQGAMQVISTGSYTVADVSYTTVSFQLVKNGSISIKKIKIEEGNHVSPYSISSQDDSVIEYDTSGFGNNGTKTANLDWSSNTPKYIVSTVFNSTGRTGVNFPNEANPREKITIALWGYKDNWDVAERLGGKASSSSGWCIGDYGSENTMFGFFLESGNGGYNTISGFRQLSSGWHHFVITFDGFDLKYYLDGECISTKTWSTQQYLKVGTGDYNLGSHTNSSYYFNGNLSDFRIYATALSASDVLSLYQNSAYIDSSGNIYGAVHLEV